MSSITEDLKRTFDLASFRQRAKNLTRPADLEKMSEITKRYEREVNKQEKLYKRDYKTRVEKALQARIDKAGAKNLTLKHRLFGSDNFDKSALTRQAHRDVQHDHSRRMSQLASGETRELDALDYARMIEPLIRDGNTMPFYRAYDYVGGALSEKLNITETGAKELMTTAYRETEGRELYEFGKALEKKFIVPDREPEQQAREMKRDQAQFRKRA